MDLSVSEIYCERLRDLLSPAAEGDSLVIKEDPLRRVYMGTGRQGSLAHAHTALACRGVYVEGLSEVPVTSEAELVAFMQQGIANRAVSATAMNAESSRSHLIVTLRMTSTAPGGEHTCYGKLSIVDLAGSERQSKTLASGKRESRCVLHALSPITPSIRGGRHPYPGLTSKEGSLINKSLSALGNVIAALTETRAQHVPYRDSKLTRLLQDSLGGCSNTALIVCCSPAQDNAAETLSTLRFGSRAKGIKNRCALA